MKFFDYKIFILIGITIVIYFIYKEVEYLRNKVQTLEMEYNKLQLKSIPEITNNNIINKNDNNIINKNDNNLNLSPKIITIDLSPTKSTIDEYENNDNEQNISIINSSSIETSLSSKHLAIYSNDNEQYDETQNSLLDIESIDPNNQNLLDDNNDDNNEVILDLISNVNDLVDMVYLTMENNSSINADKVNIENNLDVENNLSIISIAETNIVDNTNELVKKKLPEIKKIAETMKIPLLKKINGQTKAKTKVELINEINQIK